MNTSENPDLINQLNENEKGSDYTSVAKNQLLDASKQLIDSNSEFSEEQKEYFNNKVAEALDLAMNIHADQKPRPDGPYVNHILRVSNRIIEEYGVADPELIISALLHDSVEDQADKLAQSNHYQNDSMRNKALANINERFGPRVTKIVSKLSNPESSEEGISAEQKNIIYKEHVQEAIEDLDVLPIKLSDFSDNALNLEAVSDVPRRLKLSKKYLPVMQVFVDRLANAQELLPEDKITEMVEKLQTAINNTKEFVENNS